MSKKCKKPESGHVTAVAGLGKGRNLVVIDQPGEPAALGLAIPAGPGEVAPEGFETAILEPCPDGKDRYHMRPASSGEETARASASVGYSKAYAEGFDRIFGVKPDPKAN